MKRMPPRWLWLRVLRETSRRGAAQTICGGLDPHGDLAAGYRARRPRQLERRIQHCLKLVYPYQTFAKEIVANPFE